MKSILQTEKKCIVCGSPYVQYHHIYGGPWRNISDKHGFTCYLCLEHHTGQGGVHGANYQLRRDLQKRCQRKYEESHTHEEFMELVGRDYLNGYCDYE